MCLLCLWHLKRERTDVDHLSNNHERNHLHNMCLLTFNKVRRTDVTQQPRDMIDNDIRKCTGKYQIIHLSSNLININKTIKCGKITINHSNPRRNFTLVSEPHLGRPPPRPAPGQRPICPRWSSHWSGWTSARAAAPTHRHARS